jgi:hypothetical protein
MIVRLPPPWLWFILSFCDTGNLLWSFPNRRQPVRQPWFPRDFTLIAGLVGQHT